MSLAYVMSFVLFGLFYVHRIWPGRGGLLFGDLQLSDDAIAIVGAIYLVGGAVCAGVGWLGSDRSK